jgi:hypothetical protein
MASPASIWIEDCAVEVNEIAEVGGELPESPPPPDPDGASTVKSSDVRRLELPELLEGNPPVLSGIV